MPKKSVSCDHVTDRQKCRVCSPFNWAKNKYRTHHRNAKRRDIASELTQDRYIWLINSNCTYCGVNHAGGVDRVDSKQPYTVENSVPCCAHCNSAKGTLPVEVFLSHSQRIANRIEELAEHGTSENYYLAHAQEPSVVATLTR